MFLFYVDVICLMNTYITRCEHWSKSYVIM